MKKIAISLAILLALAVGTSAQVPQCNITDTLFRSAGASGSTPCTSCTLTITKTVIGGSVISTSPVTITSHATTGAISFYVPRGSLVTIKGNFVIANATGGIYDFTQGLELYVPSQASAVLGELQKATDALLALVTPSPAPSTADYIVGTANASLSAEQSLGALTTGLLKNTVSGSTGTLSIAIAGTDYENPLTFAARLSRSTNTIDLATSGVTAGSCTACDLTIDAYGRVTAKASGSGGGTVSSVFGRTGAVVAATNDYTFAQIDKTTSSLADLTTRSASDLSSGTLAEARGGAGTINGILKANGSGTVSAAVSGTDYAPATSGTSILKGNGSGGFSNASGGTDYEVPITFSIGLTRSTNTVTVNTSQNIATLSNLTSNGLVTTSGGAGTLGVTVPGTGILTALAVNVGSAGAPVLFNGAGGTPSSITLSNGTGLPLTTGVTGDLPFSSFVQAGSAGFVGATASGDYSHRTPTQVTAALDAFTGDSGSGGVKGLVPAPASGDAAANKYLKADGTWATVSGGSGITIGTTTITSGTNTRVLFNNSGVVGEYPVTGSTNVVLSGSPTIVTPAITTSAIVTRDSLGTTTATGVELTNTTAAAAGAQQVSPATIWTGQGWKTNATAASQTVNFQAYVLPVQGAANPTVNLVFASQVNAGGYTTRFTFDSSGNLYFGDTTAAAIKTASNGILVGTANNRAYIGGTNTQATNGILLASSGTLAWSSDSSVTGFLNQDTFFIRKAAASIQMGSTDAASPVAQTLSVQNATGGTNTAGATWTHQASLGTSQGAPGRYHITGGAMIAASGTTQQTAVDRAIFNATKVLTNNSATTIVNVTNASNTSTGGVIDYCVEVFDGTDTQYECGMATYGISNKAGAFTGNTVTKFGNHQNATSGTLTVTIAISGANPGALSVNANSSLSPSTGYPRMTYSLRNLGQQAVSVQ